MKKVECFKLVESSRPGKWMIMPVHENFHLTHTEGSFNVIAARVLGLSYAQYLRLCRDIAGAELVGKTSKYPVPYFNYNPLSVRLCILLNTCANAILYERQHGWAPEFDINEAFNEANIQQH